MPKTKWNALHVMQEQPEYLRLRRLMSGEDNKQCVCIDQFKNTTNALEVWLCGNKIVVIRGTYCASMLSPWCINVYTDPCKNNQWCEIADALK